VKAERFAFFKKQSATDFGWGLRKGLRWHRFRARKEWR
jgi:hypothetical protein